MVDDDISFIYEENTEVELSCAATLKDQMWVLGGSSQKRQVIFKQTDEQQPDKQSSGIAHFRKITFEIIFLDEHGPRMQIDCCRRITIRLLCWWM